MKFAIVDDEKKATDLLEKYVKEYAEKTSVEFQSVVFHNPSDFLETYSGDYDLVFMDVEMPGLNGIETARELRRMDADVVLIFITNMAQYAIHGYEVEAIDYVLKPLSYADFSLKLQKALRYITRNQDAKITITTKDGIVQFLVSDIHYVEVTRHYLVYHTSREAYTARGVMKDVEEQLSEHHFMRCNHGCLVNLKYVQSISGNEINVAGEHLSISRGKKADFLTAFAKYVGGM